MTEKLIHIFFLLWLNNPYLRCEFFIVTLRTAPHSYTPQALTFCFNFHTIFFTHEVIYSMECRERCILYVLLFSVCELQVLFTNATEVKTMQKSSNVNNNVKKQQHRNKN